MLASLLAATLIAAAPTTPLDVVKAGNTEVQKAASAPNATVEQLADVVEKFVDFEELSKRALGDKEWNGLTPAQRKDFTETMRGLLRASYAQKAIGQGGAAVKYGEESVKGNEATVGTTISVKKDRIPVDYHLYKTKDGKGPWRVYDVVTDDVSLVETYHLQFRKLMHEQGFNGLLGTLKTKREQLEKSAKNPPKAQTQTDTASPATK